MQVTHVTLFTAVIGSYAFIADGQKVGLLKSLANESAGLWENKSI